MDEEAVAIVLGVSRIFSCFELDRPCDGVPANSVICLNGSDRLMSSLFGELNKDALASEMVSVLHSYLYTLVILHLPSGL